MNLDCPQYNTEGQHAECPHYKADKPEGDKLQPATEEDAADDLHAISSEPNIKMVSYNYTHCTKLLIDLYLTAKAHEVLSSLHWMLVDKILMYLDNRT